MPRKEANKRTDRPEESTRSTKSGSKKTGSGKPRSTKSNPPELPPPAAPPTPSNPSQAPKPRSAKSRSAKSQSATPSAKTAKTAKTSKAKKPPREKTPESLPLFDAPREPAALSATPAPAEPAPPAASWTSAMHVPTFAHEAWQNLVAIGPVATASLLAGLAAGWQFRGIRTVLAIELDPLPATATMAAIVAILAVAAGMLLPENMLALAEFLVRTPRSSINRRFRPAHSVAAAQSEREDGLPWLSLALAAGLAGILTLGAVLVSPSLFEFHGLLLERFFWNNYSLAGLEWSVVILLLAAPCLVTGLLLVGLAVAGEDRLGPHGLVAIHAGFLVGMGCALGLGGSGFWKVAAEREAAVGTLPLFILAAGAVCMSHREERRSREPRRREQAAPESSLGSGFLFRTAPLVAALAAAVLCIGLVRSQPERIAGTDRVIATIFAFIAVGCTGAAIFWSRRRWSPAFGPLVWACGVGGGAGAILTAWTNDSSILRPLIPAIIALPFGHALYGTTRLWMLRATSRPIGYAHLTVMLLAGTAIGLTAGRWWALPHLGAMGTLAAGSLLLLAWGGLLDLHAEDQTPLATRFHLAVVFASLAAAIILFPAATRAWTRRDLARMAAHVQRDEPPEALVESLPDARTACIVGVSPSCLKNLPAGRTTTIEVLPLSFWQMPAVHGDARLNVVSMPAARALRLSRTRYQLIYQALLPGADDPALYCSAEWLSCLNRRLAAGGTLILDLPLVMLPSQAVADVAATLAHVTGQPCDWKLAGGESAHVILRSRPAPTDTRAAADPHWQSIDALFALAQREPSVHSMRRWWAARDAEPDNGFRLHPISEPLSEAPPDARSATPTRALP